MTVEPLFALWVYLAATPLAGLTLTLALYAVAWWCYVRTGMHPLANPVLIAVVLIIVVLTLTRTSYPTYFDGAQFVHFLLGPAVVGLAVPLAREWPNVRRIIDGRPFIVVPDGGLTIYTYGYAENLAHATLLAVDQPEASAGEIFNAADATAFTLAQTIEIIASALDHPIEMVSMPYGLAPVTRPLVRQLRTTHRVVSVDKLVHQLGYRDVVPAAEAIARTARWLVANPPSSEVEARLEDPFDYAAEDRLVSQWRALVAAMQPLEFAAGEPGLTLGHQGPGTNNPRRDHRV